MMDEDDTLEEEMLAAEYALGLLSPQEAAAFEVLLSEDAVMRSVYARWATDFASIAVDIPDAAPPEDMLTRIKQQIFVPQVDDAGFATVAVNAEGATALPDPVGDPVSTPETSPTDQGDGFATKVQNWLQKMGLLPAMAGGVIAAMAVLWLVNISGVFTPAATAFATATLVSDNQSLIVEVGYVDDGETLTITRSAGAAPEGQALELWLLKEGAAPVSLGVLPSEASGTLQVAAAIRPLLRGAQCAISIEPPGGSPTGQPTGDIVAVAPIIWET